MPVPPFPLLRGPTRGSNCADGARANRSRSSATLVGCISPRPPQTLRLLSEGVLISRVAMDYGQQPPGYLRWAAPPQPLWLLSDVFSFPGVAQTASTLVPVSPIFLLLCSSPSLSLSGFRRPLTDSSLALGLTCFGNRIARVIQLSPPKAQKKTLRARQQIAVLPTNTGFFERTGDWSLKAAFRLSRVLKRKKSWRTLGQGERQIREEEAEGNWE